MLNVNQLFTRNFAIALIFSAINLLSQPVTAENPADKITFDLSAISPEGLIGDKTKNNLRSVSYEFCIPAKPATLKEVKAIDKTVQYSRSRGRIGCNSNQYLCIGETHQPQWQTVLLKLTKLDYVKKIDQFWGE